MVAIPIAAWSASRQDVVETPSVAIARQVGTLALLGGLALIVVSSWLLRRAGSFTALPHPLASGALVESGPYRLIRHPIYAGLVLAGVGVALIRISPPVAVLTMGLAVILDLKRRREEAWLRERYPAYAAYMRRTKALVPFVY